MQIETARLADIPALSALLAALFEQEAEFTPAPAAQSAGLARIIGDPAVGVVLLARQDARVIGMVNLLFTVSTALGAPVALLEDLVVDAGCRGAGVGGELLAAAVAAARARGCRRITLLTDRGNDAAQRFYRQRGFAPSNMLPMRLLLA